MTRNKRFANAAAASVALVWLGMLVGVSFLATPVKFQAPSLDLPVALDVGRVTFALFSRIEWIPAVLLLPVVVLPRLNGWMIAAAIGIIALLVAEFFWLLPVLDARVAVIIAGEPLPSSPHHLLYASAEVVKALLLLAIGLGGLLRLASPPAASASE
ncbi:hypothetical protein [Mesorhizobium xinjiangense]|uniref:hypothetical protein n=1 Tax=Mesorhizobium xinjiangense TaxID=2678685 RepID=UPI0012EE4476|nr:hypothetical protein [Mesorhizobium xinjiangense]